jgi:transposase InsO family protein
MSELCERRHISRKTGYKWIARYGADPVEGLRDRSRRPHTCPHAIRPDVRAAIVAARRRRRHRGADLILRQLHRQHPDWPLPAVSTVYRLFHGAELMGPRRRRVAPHPGRPQRLIALPNDVWTLDFKGQFRTRDGRWCYPLTLLDGASRFLLACQALTRPDHAHTQEVLRRAFATYGLPTAIRSDNGPPFATTGLARLSRLAVWWIRLGIVPELIEPGAPQQNGRHERFHRTLKAETTRPPAPRLTSQQRRFTRFRHYYNHERPHEALGLAVPADRYIGSPRALPARLPPIEYAGDAHVRRVDANGHIQWHQRMLHISLVLAGEPVALVEIDDGVCDLYFCHVRLARFDQRRWRLTPVIDAHAVGASRTVSASRCL